MPCTLLKKKRLLPIPGKVLAALGQQVEGLDVVAQTELPGKVFSVNVANRLAVGPDEIKNFISGRRRPERRARSRREQAFPEMVQDRWSRRWTAP
jgi:hypothetical protein